jgi:hypothetical protein
MTSINTNVSDYTLSELMAIVEVEDLTPEHIIENTNYYIRKYKTKNPSLSVFFKEIQSQLLQYAEGLDSNDENEGEDGEDGEDENEAKIMVEPRVYSIEPNIEGFGNMNNEATYNAGDKQISDWYQNQNLTQSDQNQVNKITDRKQKIQVFGNQNVPMKREQIATTDTYNLPVKQDSLNPNLKNTINRFINLDSQFRQYTSGIDSTSTDYTCDLSDTLKNVLSLSLYSYQIPFSWYAIDIAYGNTCFWIYDMTSNITVPISIPSGNYSQQQFITQLNSSFLLAGFTFPSRTNVTLYPSPPYPTQPLAANTPAYYNSNSGIVTLFLADGSYNGSLGSFNIATNTQIIFYDFTGALQCNVNCLSKSNHYFNNTLGWIMGYRLPYYNVDVSGNPGSSILDLTGTKYLILVIDDYNQNHVNNSLVSISQFSNNLKMPTYYSPDLPYTCVTPAQQGNNLAELIAGVQVDSLFNNQTSNSTNGLLIAGKYQQDYTSTQIMLPSAPRTLTNAQLYTINSINSNNNNLTNYLAKAPTSSDILAIIPVKTSVGVQTGSLLVEFSGSLQDSVRTYFGPVNIERLAVKLLDDKGNVLNLNGNDWCVSLIAECLYQY